MLPRKRVAHIAPQAENGLWLPYNTLAPQENNQPHMDFALQTVTRLLGQIREKAQSPLPPILLGGFGQGASLACEYALRFAGSCRGLILLSGGAIGSDEDIAARATVSLKGVRVFMGFGGSDFHLPLHRVHTTARVLRRAGADVTVRIYPHMGHIINADEIQHCARLLRSLLPPATITAQG